MVRRNKKRTTIRRSKGGFFRKFFFSLFVLIVIAGGISAYILFETEKPELQLNAQIKYVGSGIELPFEAQDNKSGIKSLTITLEQQGKITQLFNRTFQRKAWFKDAGPQKIAETITVDTKRAKFDDGEAFLVFRVRDFSLNSLLQGNETTLRVPVIIDTKPPKVSVTYSQQYIRPGGSGIVLYRLSETVAKHGIVIDNLFFQGFPLTNGSKNYIAYICLPWNKTEPDTTKVIAVDEAGNEGKSSFFMKYIPAQDNMDSINVSKGFLKNKTPEFEDKFPDIEGAPLDKFLFINNTIRQKNAETIKQLCASPAEERFWKGRFLRMPGAKKADFADQRTYFYQGQPIDKQTHLGIDLASTAHADVRAANRGKVIFADYLGIYGNMILLDHGQGLFSLYSHLSRIDVEKEMMVETDQHLGNTGITGMAGGDHLHFSILIHGIFVSPVEWWDQNWINLNIDNYIGSN